MLWEAGDMTWEPRENIATTKQLHEYEMSTHDQVVLEGTPRRCNSGNRGDSNCGTPMKRSRMSVSECDGAPGDSAPAPPLLELSRGSAVGISRELKKLAESVLQLRHTIVSGRSLRGSTCVIEPKLSTGLSSCYALLSLSAAHLQIGACSCRDRQATCLTNDLAALMGATRTQYHSLLRHLRNGTLPDVKFQGSAALCVRRLAAVRFWVLEHGIVQLAAIKCALLLHFGEVSCARRQPTKRRCTETRALPNEAETLMLPWETQADDLRRTMMVRPASGTTSLLAHLHFASGERPCDSRTQRCFGYNDVYDWQREVINALLGGQDAIVARPTGDGKSICFQLPVLVDALRVNALGERKEDEVGEERAGMEAFDVGGPIPRRESCSFKTVFVVTPNVSLMVDQVRQLNCRLELLMGGDLSALGVAAGAQAACFLGSAQTDSKIRATVERAAMAGEYRLVYITERLIFGAKSMWIDALRRLHDNGQLLFIAVDEAHVVLEWPENDFRGAAHRLAARCRVVARANVWCERAYAATMHPHGNVCTVSAVTCARRLCAPW